jgi:hypothetical protein
MENMTPLWFILFLAIAAGAGYLFGLLDSKVTGSLKKGAEEKEKEKEARLGEVTALSLNVDPAQKLHLDLDGARLLFESITPEQRRRLIQLLSQIRPFIEGGAVAPAPKEPMRTPITAPPGAMLVPDIRETPKVDIIKGMRIAIESSVIKKMPEEKPISIVALIDKVLQKRLMGTPLALREIRMEEGPIGEVIVCVGKQKFDGIDAVPDAEVQSAIRAAIEEWNKSQ